jgi:hypothetical protein
VQGLEKEVLEGATEVLKRKKALYLELPIQHLHEGSWTFREAINFIDDLGFQRPSSACSVPYRTIRQAPSSSTACSGERALSIPALSVMRGEPIANLLWAEVMGRQWISGLAELPFNSIEARFKCGQNAEQGHTALNQAGLIQ